MYRLPPNSCTNIGPRQQRYIVADLLHLPLLGHLGIESHFSAILCSRTLLFFVLSSQLKQLRRGVLTGVHRATDSGQQFFSMLGILPYFYRNGCDAAVERATIWPRLVKRIRHWSAAYAHVDPNVRLATYNPDAGATVVVATATLRPHQHVLREYYVLWCGAIKPEPPPPAAPTPSTARTSDPPRGRKSVSSFTTPYRLSIRSFIGKNTPWPACCDSTWLGRDETNLGKSSFV